MPAVVQSWYSGMEGGRGLADVLLGTVDASGRLPFSVPADESHLPAFDADAESFTYDRWHGYWHLARTGAVAAYPFGFGMSYTTFAVDGVDVSASDGGIHIRVTIRNTGGREGSEVVQAYVRRVGSPGPERLMAFQRLELRPGEVTDVDLDVQRPTLAERDTRAHAMVVRSGSYEVRVARHAADTGTSVTVAVT